MSISIDTSSSGDAVAAAASAALSSALQVQAAADQSSGIDAALGSIGLGSNFSSSG